MTCTAHIGRKQAIWIGKETTSGTKVAVSDWIAKTSWIVKPVVTTIQDTSGYGVIDEVYDVQPVKEHSEINIEGIANTDDLSFILLGVFGEVATTGAWPYTHAFTRKNDNCHPSFTIYAADPIGTTSSAYAMIDTFELAVEAEQFVTWTANLVAGKMVDETAATPTYAATIPFRARDCNVYFADTEAGLASATAIKLTNINLNFTKNLMVHQAIGSDDIDKIFNQQFNVSWDFEAIYASKDYQDFVRDATKKYMKVEIINTHALLSDGTTNPTLTFTLGKVSFETRDQTDANNDIVKQTVGFIGSYNNTDWYTVKATLKNNRSSI